jgi:hypothetical protein
MRMALEPKPLPEILIIERQVRRYRLSQSADISVMLAVNSS